MFDFYIVLVLADEVRVLMHEFTHVSRTVLKSDV